MRRPQAPARLKRVRSRRWSAGWLARRRPRQRAHRRRGVLVGARPRRAGVPQLRALLEAHPHPRLAAEHLLPQPRAARRSCPSSTSRTRTTGASARSSSSRGSASWTVRVHRVRALLELLPRVQHRQAAVADAPHPRPARRDDRARRPARQDRQARERSRGPADARRPRLRTTRIRTRPRASRTRHARRGEERVRRAAAAGRRAHQGRDAVGVHDLRRVPGSLPGLHRSPAEDPADAHAPRAHRVAHAGGAGAHVLEHREELEPVGHRRREAHGVGRGAQRADGGGPTRTPSTCSSSAAPARSTTASSKHDARARRGAATRPSVSFAVLGESEQCAGDPARRAGNEYLFQTQARSERRDASTTPRLAR